MGASVVNALSKNLCVRVRRNGKLHEQQFSRGRPLSPIAVVGEARGTGTYVRFAPDGDIFEGTVFDADIISQRLEVKTYLHDGLRIIFKDESTGQRKNHEFRHEGSIAEYLTDLLAARSRQRFSAKYLCRERR